MDKASDFVWTDDYKAPEDMPCVKPLTPKQLAKREEAHESFEKTFEELAKREEAHEYFKASRERAEALVKETHEKEAHESFEASYEEMKALIEGIREKEIKAKSHEEKVKALADRLRKRVLEKKVLCDYDAYDLVTIFHALEQGDKAIFLSEILSNAEVRNTAASIIRAFEKDKDVVISEGMTPEELEAHEEAHKRPDTFGEWS